MTKKKRNFILTGMGNSGTTLLARLANRSLLWTVEHEAFKRTHDIATPKQVKAINQGLDRDLYGTVNCFLRYNLPEYRAAYKGLLLRPMRDIYESWYSRKRGDVPDRLIATIWLSIKMFKKYIKRGVPVYYFDRYTTEPRYVTEMFRHCGITDVTVTAEDLRKKIHRKHRGDIVYKDIPLRVRQLLEHICDDFDKNYILNHRYDAIK